MDINEKLFTKGFNDGYLMARHEPELVAQLSLTPNNHDPYYNGLVYGKGEYEKEVREWAKGFSKGATEKGDRDKHKER